jgi:hypothetical protein
MFNLEDLETHFGETMEISGLLFALEKIGAQSGTLAIWKHENDYVIVSTPMFDNVAVPVEVLQHGYEVLDDDWHSLGTDGYYPEIDTYERYCKCVKVLAEKILRRARMK